MRVDEGPAGQGLLHDGQRADEGDPAPQQRAQHAREARGLGFADDLADERQAQDELIRGEPRPRRGEGGARPQGQGQRGKPQHPPVALQARARAEQDLGGHRHGSAQVAEDVGEAGDDEGHEEDHRASADGGEEGGIDERGGEGLAEGLRFLEVLGQPLEGGVEHPAALTRPHHVHVETREGTRLMLGKSIAERRAAAHRLEKGAGDRAQRGGGRQLPQHGERAVEGKARLHQRRQLLREGDEVAAADAPRAQCGHAGAGAAWRRPAAPPGWGSRHPARSRSTTVRASGASMTPSRVRPFRSAAR